VFLRRDGESADAYAARIFKRVFTEDIENVLKMEVSLHHADSSTTVYSSGNSFKLLSVNLINRALEKPKDYVRY
jgi:hypothetical protein